MPALVLIALGAVVGALCGSALVGLAVTLGVVFVASLIAAA